MNWFGVTTQDTHSHIQALQVHGWNTALYEYEVSRFISFAHITHVRLFPMLFHSAVAVFSGVLCGVIRPAYKTFEE